MSNFCKACLKPFDSKGSYCSDKCKAEAKQIKNKVLRDAGLSEYYKRPFPRDNHPIG